MELLFLSLFTQPMVQPPLVIEQVVEESIQEPIESIQELPVSIYCSCVQTARSLTHMAVPHLNADAIKPNSTPVIGGLVLLKYGEVSHVAVIKYFIGTGIYVYEGNKDKCQYSERFINLNDENIIGFWAE